MSTVKIRVGDMEYDIKPQKREEIMALLSPVGNTGVLCSKVEHMDIAQKNIDTAIQTLLNSSKQARGKGKDKVQGIWMAEDDKMATTNILNQASAIINRQIPVSAPPPVETKKAEGGVDQEGPK